MSDPTQTTDPQTTDTGRERSEFTRPRFIVGAAVGLLIALALVWLLAFPANDPATPTPGLAPPIAEGPSRSACGLPAGDQTVPQATPAARWETVGTMLAPADPAVGPGDTVTGRTLPDQNDDSRRVQVPACYAPTPRGALHAAANFVAALSSPETQLAAAETLVVEGPGRDALVGDILADPAGSFAAELAGFDFLAYDPGRSAVIDLALRSGGRLAHVPLSLTWDDGDWKVQVPRDGQVFGQFGPLTSLDDHVDFAGA